MSNRAPSRGDMGWEAASVFLELQAGEPSGNGALPGKFSASWAARAHPGDPNSGKQAGDETGGQSRRAVMERPPGWRTELKVTVRRLQQRLPALT